MVHKAERAWRAIRARNDWRLVDAEPDFAAKVVRDLADAVNDISTLERALLHAYRRRLYAALRQGRRRAAEELRQTCFLRARAYGLAVDDAADAAQETMRRVLEHLDELQAPEAIVSWALTMQRRTLRDSARRAGARSLEHALASGVITEPSEPQDVAVQAEDRVVAEQFVAMLECVLRNPMERLAIERIVFGGDKPRDVAHDLGLPLHQIRVHKSRALQRLRADPVFMYACEQLVVEPGGTYTAKEQTDDASR